MLSVLCVMLEPDVSSGLGHPNVGAIHFSVLGTNFSVNMAVSEGELTTALGIQL